MTDGVTDDVTDAMNDAALDDLLRRTRPASGDVAPDVERELARMVAAVPEAALARRRRHRLRLATGGAVFAVAIGVTAGATATMRGPHTGEYGSGTGEEGTGEYLLLSPTEEYAKAAEPYLPRDLPLPTDSTWDQVLAIHLDSELVVESNSLLSTSQVMSTFAFIGLCEWSGEAVAAAALGDTERLEAAGRGFRTIMKSGLVGDGPDFLDQWSAQAVAGDISGLAQYDLANCRGIYPEGAGS